MYADKATETKLVNAVKEAAQRIEYANPEDPEAILADCLKRRDLSEGFAKTATDALNKSYSVHYMNTHDDSDRDADHRLLDSDKVKMHMCAEDTPACPKTGLPIDTPVYVEVKRIHTNTKAASVQEVHKEESKKLTDREYLDKITDGLYKLAKGFDTFYADTFRATENIYGRHKQASEMEMDDYTIQCIFSHDHQDTNELMNTLGLHKAASKSIMIGTGKAIEMPRIIPDNDTSRTIFGLVKDASIVTTARKSVDYILKEASDLNECLQILIHGYEDTCMGKTAADGKYSDTIAEGAGNIVGAIPGFAAGVIGGATGGLMNLLENATQAANNNLKSFDSADVIDTKLINEDRRIKNLEAWAEVAADRELARYPITDLFEITQKLIKANPSFERPDAVPMLVDTVKQVMSQGGNIGLALHGATAKTLSDIAKARGSNITGNDLYGIRSTITGKKEPGQYYNIAGMFMKPIAEGSKLMGEGVTNIAYEFPKGTVKGVVGLVDEIRNAGTRRLENNLKRVKLQKDLENLTKQPTAEEQLLKDLKFQNALAAEQGKATDRQEQADKKELKKQQEQDVQKFKAEQENARKEVAAVAADTATPKAVRNALLKAIAKNEDAVVAAYMSDPDIVKDENKLKFLEAIPELGKDTAALDAISKNPVILDHPAAVSGIRRVFSSTDDRAGLQKALVINDPIRMAALYDRAGTAKNKAITAGGRHRGDTGNTSGGDTSNTSGGDTGNTSGGDTGNTSGGDTGNTSGGDTGNTSGGDTRDYTINVSDNNATYNSWSKKLPHALRNAIQRAYDDYEDKEGIKPDDFERKRIADSIGTDFYNSLSTFQGNDAYAHIRLALSKLNGGGEITQQEFNDALAGRIDVDPVLDDIREFIVDTAYDYAEKDTQP